MTYKIHLGNNLDILPTLPDNSIDSIVTDPPYELAFMGKKWDNTGIAYSVELWQQCLRVLKPGGHLLSFGGTRTWHRVAVAIEDAGFEVRDSIAWMYGSGFPKSLDISKAIDKSTGAEREVIGSTRAGSKERNGYKGDMAIMPHKSETIDLDITAPSTPEAKQWQGWGTALKPAFEPIVVARKPIEGTVAANVLKWGTGGLNIDGSRIVGKLEGDPNRFAKTDGGSFVASLEKQTPIVRSEGRWPANVILGHTEYCSPTGKTLKSKTSAGNRTATFGTQDTQSGGDGSGGWSGYEYETEIYSCIEGCPVKLLDEQSGIRPGGNFPTQRGSGVATGFGKGKPTEGGARSMNDSGGASRFFYVAKANKKDRNEGLDELPIKRPDTRTSTGMGTFEEKGVQPQRNFHPTVKPTDLMRYLIKLVTPPNGIVLDPFTGSGSTGKAAILEGFDFIGIELTKEYLPIIEGRLKHAERIVAERKEQAAQEEQEKLF